MKIDVCPCTLESGFESYSPVAIRNFADGKKVSHILTYDSFPAENETKLFDDNRERISLSGVQSKYSVVIDDGVFRLTRSDEQGRYILKPKLPRQAKILIYEDKDKKKIVGAATVTQVEVKDFNGKWKFNAYTGSADDKKAVTVDTEFTAFEGENGNNILVTGLYQTSDVEGKVVVDSENASAKVGVYVSSKKFYNSGKGTNCVLLPECAKAEDSWNDDNLVKFPKESGEFSASDSDWIWFNYDFESGSLKYIFSDKKKEAQKSDKGLYYCGLSFGNVKAGAIDGTAPAKLYEARYNGSDANGMFFSK